jgi:hypothetical protein
MILNENRKVNKQGPGSIYMLAANKRSACKILINHFVLKAYQFEFRVNGISFDLLFCKHIR